MQSKTGGRAELLIWIRKGIEEKGFRVRNVSPLRDPLKRALYFEC